MKKKELILSCFDIQCMYSVRIKNNNSHCLFVCLFIRRSTFVGHVRTRKRLPGTTKRFRAAPTRRHRSHG
jgi:hypothetical protein